ncbi:MAG TPA: HAD hydrolase-like protein [Ktedonobacteraceae bacterium]
MKNLIIFDLDGVITSEEAYWDCAGLILHELLYSPRYWHVSTYDIYRPAANARESREFSRATLPEWLILSFKARALNSNWDTGYAAICLDLLDLLSHLPERANLLPLQPYDEDWTTRLREQIATTDLTRTWGAARLHESWRAEHPFDLPVFHGATGLELFERLDAHASAVLDLPVEDVFGRNQPFWRFCQQLFQEWLLGDALYTQTYGQPPAQPGKPGCLFFEESLLPVEQIRATLEALRTRGYTLGIASGRVLQEAEKPLEHDGLLGYFSRQHMGTYDMVTRGEEIVRVHLQDPQTERGSEKIPRKANYLALGKPHPFHFQAAADWETALRNALNQSFTPLPTPFIAVGDSTSDILSGRGAGALTVAVLTGARTPEARELFLKSLPDFIIEDMTGLPALLDEIEQLITIQKLQFERREVAEKLLRLWFARQMDLATENVRLTPKAVSLNSFNGFYTSAGQEFFFKTHVEAHGVLNEYYHADLLDQTGYNVVQPLRLLREKDRQMVIYPVITEPVMFDLMRDQETGQDLPAGITAQTLLEAERAECRHLLEIYKRTLQPAQDTSLAPIHQLFWHRLTRRLYEFYADRTFPLPGNHGNLETTPQPGSAVTFNQIMHARWTINGVEQFQSLGELVSLGQRILDPKRAAATVVGHGDAHFGNVFLAPQAPRNGTHNADNIATLTNDAAWGDVDGVSSAEIADIARLNSKTVYEYLYFDPAFAGQHSPLLDIVKPFFHNIFATWMYFPYEIAQDFHISVHIESGQIIVKHDYQVTPLRQDMLRVKQEELLLPLVAWLAERGALPEDWRDILRLALMCCPLLTVDLCDTTKRPPEIGWLGLSQALQLGNSGLFAWKEDEQ